MSAEMSVAVWGVKKLTITRMERGGVSLDFGNGQIISAYHSWDVEQVEIDAPSDVRSKAEVDAVLEGNAVIAKLQAEING